MAALSALLVLFFSFGALASDPQVVGRWQFYKKIYQNKEWPEGPGSLLRLFYEFSEEGESRLYWWHEGEGDHCYRKATFRYVDGFLEEEVFWVDPQNTYGCNQDIDMQLGRKTRTPAFFIGSDFILRLHLNEESLDYVWRRTSYPGPWPPWPLRR